MRPLSENGRIFSMVIIITGVGAFACTFATSGEQLISGQLVSNLRQRGTEAMLRRLKGHHIVVGYGNTGSAVRADIVAVKRGGSGEMVDVNDDTVVERGDVLILVGAPAHVEDAVEVLTRAQS